MANATLQTIGAQVAAKVGDPEGVVYDEGQIAPFVNNALGEITLYMRTRSIKEMLHRAQLTVPAGTTAITRTSPASPNNLPDQLRVPEFMWEATPGQTANQNFARMIGPRILPRVPQGQTLVYWDWKGEEIKLVGATTDRIVQIDFFREVDPLVLPTDKLFIPDSILPIVSLVCAQIAVSRGATSDAVNWKQEAMLYLQDIAGEQVKAQQSAPLRRSPYRRWGYWNNYWR